MRTAFRLRLRILLGLIAIFALLLIARLYMVQIMDGGDYALRAQHQYVSSGQSFYDRGSIYFTRKDGTLVSAATLTAGFLVAIDPEKITDAEAAYAAVSAHASTTREDFMASAAKKTDPYEEIAHHVDEADGEALDALDIPGVSVLRERWRSYPGGDLAAHEVGFVAYGTGDDVVGQYGLERYYEQTLERPDSDYRDFFAQLFANIGSLFVDAKQAREGDVVTSIEPEVEARLTDDLNKVQAEYHSKETGGIIMDPSTGEIIALTSVPTFDPNDLSDADASTFPNPLVEHVYEFGSIVKTLTMASGIDAGAVTENTTYDDKGCLELNGYRVCNYDHVARGVIPMQQVLSQSLNVGATFVADQLGAQRFTDYFKKLDLGTTTGIDLPGETHGLISNLNNPDAVELANASFGQGIATTPVEMIRALGSLANNGAMVTPHLATKIVLSSGVTKKLDWGAPVQVFKPSTAQVLSRMLTYVYDNNLSNGTVRIPSMSVTSKTGTAQLIAPDGSYYQSRYFHSFFGYFPSYDPRFVILLYTLDPQNVEYASETLTPTYVDLVHYLIDYYQIPPDRPDNP